MQAVVLLAHVFEDLSVLRRRPKGSRSSSDVTLSTQATEIPLPSIPLFRKAKVGRSRKTPTSRLHRG